MKFRYDAHMDRLSGYDDTDPKHWDVMPTATRSPMDEKYMVNVPSPFPRERGDRNYGPFDSSDDAHAFLLTLPQSYNAQVRTIFPPDAVRAP